MDQKLAVAQRKQKTGAYCFMNVELPRPTYISSWDNVKYFLSPAGTSVYILLERHGKPHLSPTGSGSSPLVSGPREPVASKTSTNIGFSSTGVGRSCLASQVTLLVKDGQQDFFMSVGSWEMANGRWHIDQ